MAKNDFKSFATAANANVTTQANWEALPALLSGFSAGKASSAQVNKALRQASFIAAALAQYTANKSGQDVLDDGDVAGFIAKMAAAFGKDYQAFDATLTALAGLATGANKLPYFTGNDAASQTDLTEFARTLLDDQDAAAARNTLGAQPLNDTLLALAGLDTLENTLPYFIGADRAALAVFSRVGRDIAGAGTINDVLQYLQLGEAAKLNVGTTTGTVAAGDDLRISGALQKNNNLSDLPNKGTARANLGLGSSAVAGIGSSAGTVAPGNVTFGISQTWKNVSSQREYGVLYTNSSTRPIVTCLRVDVPASTTITLEVDSITTDGFNATNSSSQEGFLLSIVPPGIAYRVWRIRGSSQNILSWVELS